MATEVRIDALLPQEMATRAEYLGARKAELPLTTMFTLSILAGAFIGFGAMFATTTAAGTAGVLPYGVGEVADRICLLPGFGACRCWWSRIIHR